MAWVRSEYAGELAVLSAWIAMVLPWNVVYGASVPTRPIESNLSTVRFSIVELQFRAPGEINIDGEQVLRATESFDMLFSGVHLAWDLYLTTPPMALAHHEGDLFLASLAWSGGALALVAAFTVSLGLYVREASFEAASPVDPVRLIGLLLGVATVATGLATVFYYFARDVAGFPIPVGVLVMGALSIALLRVERR